MDIQVRKFDEAARMDMARLIMEMFGQWQLSLEDQHTLLALPDTVRKRQIYKLGEDIPLPDDRYVLERAEHLLGIADALCTYFPNSRQARSRFIRSHSKKFRKRTPLQIMMDDGLSGLIRIRSHLDCTYAWDISGSKG